MLRFTVLCLLIIAGFATIAWLLGDAMKPAAAGMMFYVECAAGFSCGASVALLAHGGGDAG